MLRTLYDKYREIISYLIVGGLTTAVSLAVYYLCVYTFLDPYIAWQLQAANVLSWIASVTFAYFANRRYVFRSTSNKIVQEVAKFYSARLITLAINMVAMFLLVTVLGLNDKIVKLFVSVIVIIGNYIFGKFLVFKK